MLPESALRSRCAVIAFPRTGGQCGLLRLGAVFVPFFRSRAVVAASSGTLKADGVVVSTSQLCRWFEVPRRTVYYRETKAPSKVQAALAEPIKALIEQEPSFG